MISTNPEMQEVRVIRTVAPGLTGVPQFDMQAKFHAEEGSVYSVVPHLAEVMVKMGAAEPA